MVFLSNGSCAIAAFQLKRNNVFASGAGGLMKEDSPVCVLYLPTFPP